MNRKLYERKAAPGVDHDRVRGPTAQPVEAGKQPIVAQLDGGGEGASRYALSVVVGGPPRLNRAQHVRGNSGIVHVAPNLNINSSRTYF